MRRWVSLLPGASADPSRASTIPNRESTCGSSQGLRKISRQDPSSQAVGAGDRPEVPPELLARPLRGALHELLQGVGGEPAPGIGDEAAWFGGAVGVLSLRQGDIY